MARNVGSAILKTIALVGGVAILAIVVLTAGSTLMPGTKVRRLFGASPEALAGNAEGSSTQKTLREFADNAGADMAPDAGTDAGTLASDGR
ncbi:hypothetical protein JRI60_09255 [Archangium violaceum]|uniref:hypothetical protein n=1 Tax=Archangium violaceum TaxID=83451 RepID=UPI0019519EAE|nr:hypothetical protein [Archangium violaceum]QRN99184.1 hypothetical protein JRI60_09255 [Archangium violaceum]